MAWKLVCGDIVRVTIQQVGRDAILADASSWPSASRIVVNAKVAHTVLTPGKQLYVQVDAISDEGLVEVSQVSAPYHRYHWPGDVVELTTPDIVASGVCRGALADPRNLEKAFVNGALPAGRYEVVIDKLRNGVAYTTAKSVLEPGVEPGTVVRARTVEGSTRAIPDDGEYELTVNRHAQIATPVGVRIDAVNDAVHGTIIDIGELPEVDRVVRCRTVEGERRVVSEAGYDVGIDRLAQIETDVGVRIDAVADDVEGTVVDAGNLPQIGDEVSARTVEGECRVISDDGYEVEVDHRATCEVTVSVCLETVGATTTGTIVDFGKLPVVGNVVPVKMEEGESAGLVPGARYYVRFPTPGLVNADVYAEVVDDDGDIPRVQVVDYNGALPVVGDRVDARIGSSKQTARSKRPPRYTIDLEGRVKRSGSAVVRITQADESIVGKVGRYDAPSEVHGGDVVGSKNDILNGSNL